MTINSKQRDVKSSEGIINHSDTKSGMSCASRAVLVLGMHRSGTSVLSRALIDIGVNFGESFIETSSENPKGYFEDKDILTLDNSFLRSIDCRWYSIIVPTSWASEIQTSFKNKALELINKKFAASKLWGVKDPRITRFSPLWESIILDSNARLYCILANRNPISVADSLSKRNEMSKAHALSLWMLYQLDGLDAVIRNGGLIVDYDFMINQAAKELERIALFLNMEIDVEKRKNFEANFLDKGLRHSHHVNTPPNSSPLLKACLKFHCDLQKLARAQGPIEGAILREAKEIWLETRDNIASLDDWFHAVDDANRKAYLTEQELQRVRSDLMWLERKWLVKLSRSFKRILSR